MASNFEAAAQQNGRHEMGTAYWVAVEVLGRYQAFVAMVQAAVQSNVVVVLMACPTQMFVVG